MANVTRVAEELDLLERGAGFLPVADPGLVRVTGNGHRDVLQRVLTQDLKGLAPGQGAPALLLAPKGQFRALMAVFAGADGTLLMAPPGRAAALAQALRTYLALSRCGAEVMPSTGALALVGAGWLEAATALGGDAAALAAGGRCAGAIAGREVAWFGRTLAGVPGATLVGGGEAMEAELVRAGVSALLPETVELARIRRGAPAWGAELTDAVLPPEVGADAETVSYSKGCYVGQETMARLKTYGHPTRALAGVRQVAGATDAPPLPAPLGRAGEEKERGVLTSWARHPDLGGVGLALVRRELAAAGTCLVGAGREFEVRGFPLW